jgi:hypothetical protein
MTFFRNKAIMHFLTTITAVAFLNLSFFLAELSAIDLKQENKALYDSLVKTFFTICEEEKDPLGGETSENESLTKELDILISAFENSNSGFFITLSKNTHFNALHLSDGASFTIHQPPEVL